MNYNPIETISHKMFLLVYNRKYVSIKKIPLNFETQEYKGCFEKRWGTSKIQQIYSDLYLLIDYLIVKYFKTCIIIYTSNTDSFLQ